MMTEISKVFLVIISLLSIFNQLKTLSDDPLHAIKWKSKVKFNYTKPWTGYVDRFIAKIQVFNSIFRRLILADMLKFMSNNLIKRYFVTYKYVKFLEGNRASMDITYEQQHRHVRLQRSQTHVGNSTS